MHSDVRRLQSHMSMLHHEMSMAQQFLDERNKTITRLNEQIGELILESDMLQSEIDTVRHECTTLSKQIELVQADRDTLIAGLAPLLTYHELETEASAARLIAVLLLSTDDRQDAWQLIQRAARNVEQVDILAECLLALLEDESTRLIADDLPHAEGSWSSLTAQIGDANLRNDLQAALTAMRTSYGNGKWYKDRHHASPLA